MRPVMVSAKCVICAALCGGLRASHAATAQAQATSRAAVGRDSMRILSVYARELGRLAATDTISDAARRRSLIDASQRAATASGDAKTQADVWFSISSAYRRLKQNDSSAVARNRSLDLARSRVRAAQSTADTYAEGRARIDLADLLSYAAQMDSSYAERTVGAQLLESAHAWDEASDAVRQLGYVWQVGQDSSNKVAAHQQSLVARATAAKAALDSEYRRAIDARYRDDADEALRHYRQLARDADAVHERYRVRSALRDQLETFHDVAIGKAGITVPDSTPAAIAAADSIREILSRALDNVDVTSPSDFGELADIYRSAGAHDSAAAYRKREVEASERRGDKRLQRSAEIALAREYLSANRFDSALVYGRIASRTNTALGDSTDFSIDEILAGIWDRLGRADSAAVAYSRAGRAARLARFPTASYVERAGQRFLQAELPDSAVAAYSQLREDRDVDADNLRRGTYGLAAVYQRMGNPARASSLLESVVASEMKRGDAYETASAMLHVAQFWHEEGSRDSTLAYVRRAMATLATNAAEDTQHRCTVGANAITILKHEFLDREVRMIVPAILAACRQQITDRQ